MQILLGLTTFFQQEAAFKACLFPLTLFFLPSDVHISGIWALWHHISSGTWRGQLGNLLES